VQFGQSLASGVFRGQEFNSVAEQTPALLKAIADGLGVDIGQLRKMANEGELTADKLVTALQNAAAGVDEQFATRVKTISQATTEVQNAFMRLAGLTSQSSGFGGGLTNAITALAEALDALTYHTEELATVALVALSAALGKVSATALGAVVSAVQNTHSHRAAALAAVARAESELQLQQRLAQVAIAEAAAAQAAVAAARADVAAAQAAVVRAKNIGVTTVRMRMVTQRTAELTAATNALTAAEARATAAGEARAAALGNQAAAALAVRNAGTAAKGTGLLVTTGRGLMNLLGGPVGLVATIGLLAASFVDWGDKAGDVKTELADLNITTEESIEKFNALSAAQQNAANS
jgi:tape measure domain-containing protein